MCYSCATLEHSTVIHSNYLVIMPGFEIMKWNILGFRPPLCTYRLNWARRASWGWLVRWMRWHCPPDTGFEIRSLAVWGRARYLSVTEAPHNTDFHTWMGKKHFCFFQTAETGNRTPNSGVKGSGANHYPRAPALRDNEQTETRVKTTVSRPF